MLSDLFLFWAGKIDWRQIPAFSAPQFCPLFHSLAMRMRKGLFCRNLTLADSGSCTS